MKTEKGKTKTYHPNLAKLYVTSINHRLLAYLCGTHGIYLEHSEQVSERTSICKISFQNQTQIDTMTNARPELNIKRIFKSGRYKDQGPEENLKDVRGLIFKSIKNLLHMIEPHNYVLRIDSENRALRKQCYEVACLIKEEENLHTKFDFTEFDCTMYFKEVTRNGKYYLIIWVTGSKDSFSKMLSKKIRG